MLPALSELAELCEGQTKPTSCGQRCSTFVKTNFIHFAVWPWLALVFAIVLLCSTCSTAVYCSTWVMQIACSLTARLKAVVVLITHSSGLFISLIEFLAQGSSKESSNDKTTSYCLFTPPPINVLKLDYCAKRHSASYSPCPVPTAHSKFISKMITRITTASPQVNPVHSSF